jgi:hypothetical protein
LDRTSSTVRRGKSALQKIDSIHHRLDECAEQATHMEGVVDRIAVEEDEVLVRFAAAHIHPDGVVVARVHAGEQSDRAQHVGLTEEARRRRQLAGRDAHGADVGLLLEGLPLRTHGARLDRGERLHSARRIAPGRVLLLRDCSRRDCDRRPGSQEAAQHHP